MWHRFEGQRVDRVYCWFSRLLRRGFLLVFYSLRYSPVFRFRLSPISSGMADEERRCGFATTKPLFVLTKNVFTYYLTSCTCYSCIIQSLLSLPALSGASKSVCVLLQVNEVCRSLSTGLAHVRLWLWARGLPVAAACIEEAWRIPSSFIRNW